MSAESALGLWLSPGIEQKLWTLDSGGGLPRSNFVQFFGEVDKLSGVLAVSLFLAGVAALALPEIIRTEQDESV